MNDLYDLLAGMDAIDYVLPKRRGLDIGNELLDDFIIDIRFEQGQPDLFQTVLDVFLGEFALTPDIPEYGIELLC